MYPFIDTHREEIADICRGFSVRRFEVFGSAARAADFNVDTSNADFLVEFVPDNGWRFLRRFFGLEAALKKLLGRPVDLVEPGAIRSPYVQTSIDRARASLFMQPDARGFLWDMQEAARAIERFTAGMDSGGAAENLVARAAVDRKFETLG